VNPDVVGRGGGDGRDADGDGRARLAVCAGDGDGDADRRGKAKCVACRVRHSEQSARGVRGGVVETPRDAAAQPPASSTTADRVRTRSERIGTTLACGAD